MGSSDQHLHRLPPSVRTAILDYMADHHRDRPVYVAAVLQHLAEQGLAGSRTELVKKAIAEAAIREGLTVGFGRPPFGLGAAFSHPIRRALVQLRRIQG